MSRIVVIGSGPLPVLIGHMLHMRDKKLDIMIVIQSLGRGISVFHKFFTDKTNLEYSAATESDVQRILGREKGVLEKTRAVAVLEDQRGLLLVRRIEKTLWQQAKVQLFVSARPPGEVSRVARVDDAQGFIEGEALVADTARLTLSLLKRLKRVGSTISSEVEVIVEDNTVKGVRVEGDMHPADYVVMDEAALLRSTALQQPRILPRSRYACVELVGPPVGDSLLLAFEGYALIWRGRRLLACAAVPAEASIIYKALHDVARIAGSRIAAPSSYLIGGVWSRVYLASPDRSPLVGTCRRWPGGLIAVMGCRGGCLSLASGISSAVYDAVVGGEGPYSVGRLERKELLREILGLPHTF